MLDPDRINAEDFELKTGSAIILLEYRVQQSPKTQMYALLTLWGINGRKYIRVSEMLIVDSMMHLRSDTPIQCRPPVAQSQLANRENTSSEPMEDVSHQPDMKLEEMDTTTTALEPATLPQNQSTLPQQPLTSPENQNIPHSPQIARSLLTSSMESQPTQYSQGLAMTQVAVPPHLRVTTSFGYNPTTPENLRPLESLYSKNHKQTIGISV
jgi:hypothetical protein